MRANIKNYGIISDKERIRRLTESIAKMIGTEFDSIAKKYQEQLNELKEKQ